MYIIIFRYHKNKLASDKSARRKYINFGFTLSNSLEINFNDDLIRYHSKLSILVNKLHKLKWSRINSYKFILLKEKIITPDNKKTLIPLKNEHVSELIKKLDIENI